MRVGDPSGGTNLLEVGNFRMSEVILLLPEKEDAVRSLEFELTRAGVGSKVHIFREAQAALDHWKRNSLKSHSTQPPTESSRQQDCS